MINFENRALGVVKIFTKDFYCMLYDKYVQNNY